MNAYNNTPLRSQETTPETTTTARELRWTTYGPVRGDCGHEHRTEYAAEACADRDARGCARTGGYSDRSVHRVGCPAVERCGTRRCTCEEVTA